MNPLQLTETEQMENGNLNVCNERHFVDFIDFGNMILQYTESEKHKIDKYKKYFLYLTILIFVSLLVLCIDTDIDRNTSPSYKWLTIYTTLMVIENLIICQMCLLYGYYYPLQLKILTCVKLWCLYFVARFIDFAMNFMEVYGCILLIVGIPKSENSFGMMVTLIVLSFVFSYKRVFEKLWSSDDSLERLTTQS